MCLVTSRGRLWNDVFGYRQGHDTERCVWLQTETGYGTMLSALDQGLLDGRNTEHARG